MGRKDIVYTEGVERFTRNELIIESVIRVILVGGWLYWGLAKPFIREATVMDWHQHHYSLEVQTISGWMLYGICSCAAIGTTIFWALVWGTKRRPMIVVLTETGRYAFGLSMSWFVTAFFTHFVKYEYGALRPDFLNRCFPSIFADLDLNLLQRIPICEDLWFLVLGIWVHRHSHRQGTWRLACCKPSAVRSYRFDGISAVHLRHTSS
eukprot:Polyplicarium_translucidae@DN2304_c0_g1_i1.p2